MNIKKIFGENLKKYRKRLKFTQEELSERINITQKHLSLIENGSTFVSAEVIERLSDVLKVPASSFFYSEEENAGGESFLRRIDIIVEEELYSAMKSIKTRARG